jgi:hypothetical protein
LEHVTPDSGIILSAATQAKRWSALMTFESIGVLTVEMPFQATRPKKNAYGTFALCCLCGGGAFRNQTTGIDPLHFKTLGHSDFSRKRASQQQTLSSSNHFGGSVC